MAAPLRAAVLAARTGVCRRIVQDRTCNTLVFQHYSAWRHAPAILSTATQPLVNHLQVRQVTFLNSVTADELWSGVTGVSNAGKKRGRGKRVGRKKTTDLNKGQVMGSGPANILWPGLNAPILQRREIVRQKQLPPNPDRVKELVRIRDEMARIRYNSLPPLQRGWSGNRFPGQSVGPPDPVADYVFENFDTKVLEFKLVTNMTGTLGRKMRFTAFVVTGNKNGLAGYGLGKSQNGRAAIRLAKNRAAQNLQYIERFNEHTVFHNMHVKFHHTKIFIHKREEGHGLVCHRALKTICELIGIKDLHCKVECSTKNIKALTYGFFEALRNQETHQNLADRKNVHVVEYRKEQENLPVVVASPSDGQVTQTELRDEEEDLEMDFQRLYFDGKVEYKRPKPPRRYAHLKSYRNYKYREHAKRNQPACQILRRAGLA